MRKENIIIEKKKNLFWKSAWWLSLGLMIEGGFALLLDVELHGIVTYSFVLYKMYRSYQKDSSHYEFLKPTSSVKDKIRDVLTYSGWNLLYGSIATFILYALVKAIVPNFESILDEIMDVFSTSDFPNFFIFILGIIGTGLLAPIVEEIIFRGFLYDKHTKYSRTKAMFLNALLFGLAHGGFLPVHYLAGIALYAI